METVSLWDNIHLDYLEEHYSPRQFSEFIVSIQNILQSSIEEDKISLLLQIFDAQLAKAYDFGHSDGVIEGRCDADQDVYSGAFKEGYEKGQEETLTLKEENEN